MLLSALTDSYFHNQLSVSYLPSYSIVYKMSKTTEKCHEQVNINDWYLLVGLTNSQEPKDVQFTVIYDRKVANPHA